MHISIQKLIESKSWDKLIKDLDKNMAEYDKQKNISASTLLSFKELQDKLQKVIDRSNDTIGTHK